MRALHVIGLAASAAFALALVAAAPVALHRGDPISDNDLFAYLAYPVQPGDWVRYRVTFAGRSTVIKTIGFGRESVGGRPTLFIETHVRALPVTGLQSVTTTGIGTDAVLKTYVDAAAFSDLAHSYRVITSALKVGSFEYEVTPGAGETYSCLSGAVYAPARSGVILAIEPVDMDVGRQTVHATHVTASFPAVALPVGGVAEGYSLEVWQSPDVPLGTVAISSAPGRAVRWRMLDYGRGYRTLFVETLDGIRNASQPAMPH